MSNLLFWLECLDRGEIPWRVEANSVEELEALRANGAWELEQALIAKFRAIHGNNVGIDSELAKRSIRARLSIHIRVVLGRTFGRTYVVEYDRVGTAEFVRIRVEGVLSLVPIAMLVSGLTLRQQRQIWRFLT